MEKFIKNLEKITNTKIYIKIGSLYEYGIPHGDMIEINDITKISVAPEKEIKEIKEIIESYVERYIQNINLSEEMYVCQDNSYAVMEVAKLTLANVERKELTEIFLKMVNIHSGARASWIINKDSKEIYFKGEQIEELNIETILPIFAEFKEKSWYGVKEIAEKKVILYKYTENEKIVAVFDKNADLEKIDTQIKMMAEEFRVVIENREYRDTLENLYFKLIKRVAGIINKRNFAHGNDYILDLFIKIATVIGKNYGLSSDEMRKLRIVSVLKDTGTILIPENILHKVEALTKHEYNILKKHPIYSANILEQTEYFEDIISEIKYHHEKWGGGGYPAERAGKEIPIVSRIIHLVDVFMALINKRVYRKRYFTEEEALEVIVSDNAEHFDPELIEIFVESFDEIRETVKNNS